MGLVCVGVLHIWNIRQLDFYARHWPADVARPRLLWQCAAAAGGGLREAVPLYDRCAEANT